MPRKRDVKLNVRAMDTAGPNPEAQPDGGLQSREASGVAPASEDLSALKRHFEISLYFLLLTGVLTLGSTGKLDLVSILVPPAALLIKGYRWWRGKGPELSNRVGGWITIGYFLFFPFDLWIISRALAADSQNPGLYGALLATVHLMLFAILVRLYSATKTRDYLFLTLMAFTSMLAAAILTVDTGFLVFFFLFMALAVSTFVGLEMWHSAQGAVAQPIQNGTRAAHRLHNALGVTSAGIAIGSLAIGAVIFLFLPRFSGGYMSGLNLQPTLISGFNDDVELGEIGEIKKSSAVVMRINVEGGPEAATGVHWGGIALTTFDGRRWYNGSHDPNVIKPDSESGWFPLDTSEVAKRRIGRRIQYTVLLEPIASTALFFTNQAESVRGRFNGEGGSSFVSQRQAYLLEDSTGSVSNPYHNFSRMQYEARSLVPAPPVAALRTAGSDYPASMRETYLQLPTLDPRIPELAKEITGRAGNPYDQARALESYLRSHYGYTLDLTGTPPPDPLAYFLFQRRAGHCEYFASAMTVMLRSVGIPARLVNGFLTGEYNDVGGDFIVRASDAHSWVEVFFPSFGWLTFDPTPPTNEVAPGMFSRLGRYWDWFQLQWSEWIINYDFVHQVTLAQNLQRVSRDWTERFRKSFADARRVATHQLEIWQERAIHTAAFLPVSFAILTGLCIFVLLLQPNVRQRLMTLWHLRLSTSTAMTPNLATLQYNEMLRLLLRRGIRKAPGQTPLEFAGSLPDGNLAEPVHELTAMYHAARFGGQTSDPRLATSLLTEIQTRIQSLLRGN
jgi:transglutaminase-like putative cysteine protease